MQGNISIVVWLLLRERSLDCPFFHTPRGWVYALYVLALAYALGNGVQLWARLVMLVDHTAVSNPWYLWFAFSTLQVRSREQEGPPHFGGATVVSRVS